MGIYAVAGAALVGALLGLPAAAAPPPIAPLPAIPLLSMTVADSAAAPHPGDRITYTVTVANRDRLPLTMTVRLVAPALLDDLTALDGGRRHGRVLTWPASIEPAQRASVRFSGVPVTDGRVAVTACVYLDGASRPTACASDVNAVALPPPATGAQIARRFAAFLGALLVVFLGWRWWRRRRSAPPTHVAEVIAAARTAEATFAGPKRPDRPQPLPLVGTPVAGAAASGPAADAARAAVEAGLSLTVTQAAADEVSGTSDGVVSATSGTPRR
jgi:hypothetical protein